MKKSMAVVFALALLAAGAMAQAQGIRQIQAGIAGGGTVVATRGTNLAPAIAAANWTCGAGWDCSVAGTLNKNADGLGTAVPNPTLTIVAGTTYEVIVTVGALTVADGATLGLGGEAGYLLNAAGTHTFYITATTTGNLIITPTPTATRFTITAVTVKALTDGTGDVTIDGNLTVRSPSYFRAPVLLPNGTYTAPGMAWMNAPSTGMYYTQNTINWAVGGALSAHMSVSNLSLDSVAASITLYDTNLYRDAANTLAQKNGNADQFSRLYGANGSHWERGVNSELVTIAAAASTDTTGDLLPADAVIEAVVVRVTTVIPTAATFTVGDATTAARFATGVAVAAGTTAVGLLHRNPADADVAGPVQAAAAKVRITPNASPGAATGVVRVEVYFSRFIAPSS
jgi:hypothetical protein